MGEGRISNGKRSGMLSVLVIPRSENRSPRKTRNLTSTQLDQSTFTTQRGI